MPRCYRKRGFTIIELLVVIAIIGLLAAVVMAQLASARTKARVTATVAQVRQVRTAVEAYRTDTSRSPTDCSLDCTAATDPLLNALGVAKWAGPHIPGGVWNMRDPWGGHVGFSSFDTNSDGVLEFEIGLDDDAPGTSAYDNSGAIPTTELIAIDKLIDDGNLTTGYARGDNYTWPSGVTTAPGELGIIIP